MKIAAAIFITTYLVILVRVICEYVRDAKKDENWWPW